MAKIGFIGLGDQGKYMAATLLKKHGQLYVGYNPGHAEASTRELVELGAEKHCFYVSDKRTDR